MTAKSKTDRGRESPGDSKPVEASATSADAEPREGEDVDDLFVRSVEGKGVVTRYASLRASRPSYIGAYRDASVEGGIVYTKEIVRIPGDEFRRFNREYLDALETGALAKVRRADYHGQVDQEAKELEAERNLTPEQLTERRKLARAAKFKE